MGAAPRRLGPPDRADNALASLTMMKRLLFHDTGVAAPEPFFPPLRSSLYARDSHGLTEWFGRKYGFEGHVPTLAEVIAGGGKEAAMDTELEASGFTKRMQGDMDALVEEQGGAAAAGEAAGDDEEDEEDSDEDDAGFVVVGSAAGGTSSAGPADEDDGDDDDGPDLTELGDEEAASAVRAFAVVVPAALRHPGSRERYRVPLWRRVLFGEDGEDGEEEEEEEEGEGAGNAGGSGGAAAASSGTAASTAAAGSDEGEEGAEPDWLNVDAETLGRVPDGIRRRLHGRGRGKARRGKGAPGKAGKAAAAGKSDAEVRDTVRRQRRGAAGRGGKVSVKSGEKGKDRRRARQDVREALE